MSARHSGSLSIHSQGLRRSIFKKMDADNELLPDKITKRLKYRLPELRRRIDLEKDYLLDRLCQDGVVTADQLNTIMGADMDERVDKLIAMVCRSSLGSYNKFRECLLVTGQGHIVHNVLDKEMTPEEVQAQTGSWKRAMAVIVGVAIAAIVGRYVWNIYEEARRERSVIEEAHRHQTAVAERFYDQYSKLHQWCSDQAWSIGLKEFYTETTWLNITRNSTKVRKTVLDNWRPLILKEGDKSLYLLITGESGIGKTTFAKQLANTWARYVIEPESVDASTRAVVEQYDYILYLRLRDVLENITFTAFIRQQYQYINHASLTYMLDVLETSPQKFLCIFDGYDELLVKAPQIVEIISRKNSTFYRLNMIITTKEESARIIRERMEQTGREAIIIGYNKTQIKSYINKCRVGYDEDIHEFTKKVESSKLLLKLAENPMYLQMLCTLQNIKDINVFTIPKLFEEYLAAILRRYSKEKKGDGRRLSKEKVLLLFKEQLVKIGKLAYKDCEGHFFMSTFSADCVESKVGMEAMDYGILRYVPAEYLSDSLRVEFYHDMFQLFMVAFAGYYGNIEILLELVRSPDSLIYQNESNIFKHSLIYKKKKMINILTYLTELDPSMSNYIMRVTNQVTLSPFTEMGLSNIVPSHEALFINFEALHGKILNSYHNISSADIHLTWIYLSPLILTKSHKRSLYDYLSLGRPGIFQNVRILFIDLAIRHSTIYKTNQIMKNWNSHIQKILPYILQSPALEIVYLWPADKAYVIIKQISKYLPSGLIFSYACDNNEPETELSTTFDEYSLSESLRLNAPGFRNLLELHIDGPSEMISLLQIADLLPALKGIRLDLGFCFDEYKTLADKVNNLASTLKWQYVKWVIPVDKNLLTLQYKTLTKLKALKVLEIQFVFKDESWPDFELYEWYLEYVMDSFPNVDLEGCTYIHEGGHARYVDKRPLIRNAAGVNDVLDFLLK